MPRTHKHKTAAPLDSTKKNKSGFFRKLVKTIFLIVLVFLVILLIAAISIRILYPPEKIKQKVVQLIDESIGGRLAIGDTKINLLRSFEFYDLEWHKNETGDSMTVRDIPIKSLKINRILLRYTLPSLIHKHLHIQNITFDSPEIELEIIEKPSGNKTGTKAKKKSETEAIAKQSPVSKQPVTADSAQLVMPIRISLDRFDLKNAVIHFQSSHGDNAQEIFLSNLSVQLSDLSLPKDDLYQNQQKVRAHLTVTSTDASARFSTTPAGSSKPNFGLWTQLNLDLQAKVSSMSKVAIDGSLQLDDIAIAGMTKSGSDSYTHLQLDGPTQSKVKLSADFIKDSANLEEFDLTVGKAIRFTLEAHAERLRTEPVFEIVRFDARILLADVLKNFSSLLPPTLNKEIRVYDPKAAINVRDTHIVGSIRDHSRTRNVQFGSTISVENLTGSFSNRLGLVDSLTFGTQFAGGLDSSGLNRLSLSADASLAKATYMLDDTTQVWCGPLSLNIRASRASNAEPLLGNGSLSVQDLLGAALTTEIHATSDGALNTLQASGKLALHELPLSNVPQVPVESTANFDLSLDVNSIDSIIVKATIKTDSLRIPEAESLLRYPPVDLKISAAMRTDESMKKIWINSLSGSLNDLLAFDAAGKFVQQPQVEFNGEINDFRLKHSAIMDWLPSDQKQSLGDLSLRGFTTLKGKIAGQVIGDSLHFMLNASLQTMDTKIDYPSRFVSLSGLNLDLSTAATEKDASLTLGIVIDTLQTDNLPGSVFCNNMIRLKAETPDFSTISLSDGEIDLPDLHANAKVRARVDAATTQTPTLTADVELVQSTSDTLSITRNFGIVGDVRLSGHLTVDTSKAHISGHLQTQELNLYLAEGATVTDVNADVYFSQAFDTKHGRLLQNKLGQFNTPSSTTVDYQLYRSYYNEALPNLSKVSVGHVDAGGYVFDDLHMDVLIGDGRLEIPQFLLNLYGGNFGGTLFLNLAGGDLHQATYRLSAHMSSVNSALLLPGTAKAGEESVLNANMQFQGQGLDPQAGIDVNGYFYITELGPKVADNFLRSLDPKGTDSGINTTRLLINRGFKPKLFFFEAKHGYLYPTITFKQPWYFPVKLSGGKVELSRMPIQFFIGNALQQ